MADGTEWLRKQVTSKDWENSMANGIYDGPESSGFSFDDITSLLSDIKNRFTGGPITNESISDNLSSGAVPQMGNSPLADILAALVTGPAGGDIRGRVAGSIDSVVQQPINDMAATIFNQLGMTDYNPIDAQNQMERIRRDTTAIEQRSAARPPKPSLSDSQNAFLDQSRNSATPTYVMKGDGPVFRNQAAQANRDSFLKSDGAPSGGGFSDFKSEEDMQQKVQALVASTELQRAERMRTDADRANKIIDGLLNASSNGVQLPPELLAAIKQIHAMSGSADSKITQPILDALLQAVSQSSNRVK